MRKLFFILIVLFFYGKINSQCTPPATFAVGPYYIPCGLFSVVISAGTNSTITTYSYSWNGPGGMSCPSGISCYNNNVNGAGVYTVTIYDTAQPGCFSTNTMSVIQATTGLFIGMSGTDTICSGASGFVSAFVSGPTTYTWSTGANTSGITVSPTLTTVYTVTAMSMISGCIGTGSFTVNVNLCTGITDNNRNKNIVISPNPNNGKFNVIIDKYIDEGEIKIVNAIGQEVFKQDVKQGNYEINCSLLSKGIYHYNIYQNKEPISRGKIIIE